MKFISAPLRRRALTPRQAALLGAALGCLTFLVIYGFVPLDVTNDAWLMHGHVEKDIICDYAGWLHYRNSAWAWPLGVIKNIGYPYGNSIAMTGPMAPFGLLFKALSPILPETFQFYGWWVLLCYALQGAGGALVLSLYTASPLCTAFGTLLFTTAPVLAERSFRHCSLAIQFTLIFAYYLYIRHRRTPQKGLWWKFALLNVTAVTVFPYFYPMVMGILVVLLLQTLRRDKNPRAALRILAANIALPLLSGYLAGTFYAKGGAAHAGFGYFSMNLNQPINPVSAGDIVWSRFLPVRALTAGQYDGFNYLGLGVLAALAGLFVYLVWRGVFRHGAREIWQTFCRHWLLALLGAGFAVYALSNVVTWGGLVLIEYPLPALAEKITGLFRASSRIFYGTYYLLYVAVAALLCKYAKPKAATALLGLILVVQLWDISPGLLWKHNYFAQQTPYENPYASELMDYVGAHYNRLLFVENPNRNEHELSVLLAQEGLVTNLNSSPLETIYGSEAFVQQKLTALRAGQVDKTEAYVVIGEALLTELSAATQGKMVVVSDQNFNLLLPVLPGETPPASAPLVKDQ